MLGKIRLYPIISGTTICQVARQIFTTHSNLVELIWLQSVKPFPDPKVTKAVIRFPKPAATLVSETKRPTLEASSSPEKLILRYFSLLFLSVKNTFILLLSPVITFSFFEQVKRAGHPPWSNHIFVSQNLICKPLRLEFQVYELRWPLRADAKTSHSSRLPAKFTVSSYLPKKCYKAMEVPRVGACQLEGVWMRLMGLARVTGP